MFRPVVSAMGMVVALVVAVAFLPTVSGMAHDLRAADAQESLGCTPATGETSCTLALSTPHIHPGPDPVHLTVQETSPGNLDRTADTTVSADGSSITVSNLVSGTPYTFQVSYEVEDPQNGQANEVLRRLPLLFVVGMAFLGAVLGTLAMFA